VSKLLMFDFLCDNGHEFEDLVAPSIHILVCPTCGSQANRQISAPSLDWKNMGLDATSFPTLGDKWARLQIEAKTKRDSE
jgi:hypothetical protein